MKLFVSLLAGACLLATAAQAQTTMPAIGANTPKGEVAKTDASLNPRRATTNESQKAAKSATRKTTKMKIKGRPAGSL